MPRSLSDLFQEATTESSINQPSRSAVDLRLPGLTVLYHPSLDRVGERALLTDLVAGRTVRLSRLEPAFAGIGEAAEPVALAHRRLSRQPILFEKVDASIRISCEDSRTQVIADGELIEHQRLFTADEIDRGIVLLLADRVVLLLHRIQPLLSATTSPRFSLVGESPEIAAVRHGIEQVGDMAVPVLLRGESGTGKELVARALHRASRRGGPFVAVNMAAIPSSLAAAELFGAARGAFTGADHKRPGYFARADGGTLFLDEIGEAPVAVQTLLLRCLETGEIQPVGGEIPRRVDVRLVAATDADLEAASADGRFRAPLLHRLAGFQILLPSLRRRREDVGRLLVEFLRLELAEVGEEHRLRLDPPWLPPEIVARMVGFGWPGNVRQLRNVVRQLVITHRRSEQISIDPTLEALFAAAAPLPTPLSSRRAQESSTSPSPNPATPPPSTPRRPADISEAELVDALRAERWRPHAAARRLGIPRPSIYHLMSKSPRLRTAGELELADLTDAHRRFGDDVAAMAESLEVSERALRRRLRQLGLL